MAQHYTQCSEFKKAKLRLQRGLRTLYTQAKTPTRDEEINERVRAFNKEYHERHGYYDLHGMTSDGAEEYVQHILRTMRSRRMRKVKVETGRGNHSKDNIPRIKNFILTEIHGKCGCSVIPEPHNDGILILKVN